MYGYWYIILFSQHQSLLMVLQGLQTLLPRPIQANNSLVHPLIRDLHHLQELLSVLGSEPADDYAAPEDILVFKESQHYLLDDLV